MGVYSTTNVYHLPATVRHRNFIVKSICIYCQASVRLRTGNHIWRFDDVRKKPCARKARKVIGVTNSRVVKVKEIYEQNTRGIFSSSVYILCNTTRWNKHKLIWSILYQLCPLCLSQCYIDVSIIRTQNWLDSVKKSHSALIKS